MYLFLLMFICLKDEKGGGRMHHVTLALWQYNVKKNEQFISYETTLNLTVSKRQLEKIHRIHHECIELTRLTYFDRLPTHPVSYYDYKHHRYYRPFEVKRLRLNVKYFDHVYATSHPSTLLKSSLKHPDSQLISPFDSILHRNQQLTFPKICEWYVQATYFHVGIPPLNAVYAPNALLYNFSFWCQLLFTEKVAHFIHWLNVTYQLYLQPGQYYITHRRCLSKFNRPL